MIKVLLTGFWICAITLASSYTAAAWKSGAGEPPKQDRFDGLNYEKTGQITVPVISDGKIDGYIVAEFVFTIDSRTLAKLSVPPHAFVVDEAFRAIYADPDLDVRDLKKFDLARLTGKILKDVNEHLQAPIVVDVLVGSFNYMPPEPAKT